MPLSTTRAVMVLALLVGLSVAIMSALGRTTQEEHERTVERQSFGNEPVKIKAIRTKKNNVAKDIIVGKKFADADDWLKGLTVNVENKSDKNINYVSVLIVYSRVENDEASSEAPLGDSLTYGASPFRQSSAPAQVQAIPPGGSAELVLTERAYDENVLALKNLKYKKSVKRIELSVEEVGFEDGTAWSKGQYWKPDPDKPGHWIPLEREAARSPPGSFFFARRRTAHRPALGVKPATAVPAHLSTYLVRRPAR